MNAIRGGILVAGAAALIGGGVLMTQHSSSHPAAAGPAAVVNGQRVDLNDGACNDIHQQIQDKADNINVGQAEQCDQQEFAALVADQKQTTLSATCQAVNDRARTGDKEFLDSGQDLVGLGFNCRQRERAINAALGQKKVTALCEGAKILKDQGDKNIDASDQTACNAELGNGEGTGQPQSDLKLTDPPQTKDLTTSNTPNTGNPASTDNGGVTKCTATVLAPGGTTASGQPNDANAPIAGSSTFDIGTKIKVTNPRTGQSTVVTVEDKNSFCAALSQSSFDKVRDPGKNLLKDAEITVEK